MATAGITLPCIPKWVDEIVATVYALMWTLVSNLYDTNFFVCLSFFILLRSAMNQIIVCTSHNNFIFAHILYTYMCQPVNQFCSQPTKNRNSKTSLPPRTRSHGYKIFGPLVKVFVWLKLCIKLGPKWSSNFNFTVLSISLIIVVNCEYLWITAYKSRGNQNVSRKNYLLTQME